MDVLSNYVDTTHLQYTADRVYIDSCKVLRNFQGFKNGDIVDVSIELVNWNVYINGHKIYLRIHDNEYNNIFAYDFESISIDPSIKYFKGVTLISDVCEKFPIGTRFSCVIITNKKAEFFGYENESVFSMTIE